MTDQSDELIETLSVDNHRLRIENAKLTSSGRSLEMSRNELAARALKAEYDANSLHKQIDTLNELVEKLRDELTQRCVRRSLDQSLKLTDKPCTDPEKMLGYCDQFSGTDDPDGQL